MAATERRLPIPTIAFPHEWRWPSVPNLRELMINVLGRQKITLDSLRTGKARSKDLVEAKSAYQRLLPLAEKGAYIELDEGKEMRFSRKPMVKSGYEDITAVFVTIVKKKEGKESSSFGYASFAEQGTAYFFFPESIYFEGIPIEQRPTNSGLNYTQQFVPEASKPLADWLLRMGKERRYLPPPRIDLPPSTM